VVEVKVEIEYVLEVAWSPEQALDLVADVPRSAAFFPGLEGLDDLGDGLYRWNMRKFELGSFQHGVRYAARYVTDQATRTVRWTTEPGDNNTIADGAWTVEPRGSGSRLVFRNSLVVSVPVPRLMARLARKSVPGITHKQVRTYLDRIATEMGGRRVG
jgi:carbon monoxide dehydrogenase subunit G